MSARDRMSQVVEKWFLVEPLLFAAWTTHAVTVDPRIGSISVHHGRVDYNPDFIDKLTRRELEEVLLVEAMRIVLKHPYSRRPDDAALAYAASNLTLQEYLETSLPLPRARDIFGSHDFDRQYYELYCQQLAHQITAGNNPAPGSVVQAARLHANLQASRLHHGGSPANEGVPADETQTSLAGYAEPQVCGAENAGGWAQDELLGEQINDRIRSAQESDNWGTIGGRWQDRIRAGLRPRLNYRAILRQFRASVLSVQRRLTRMKPNRRYGFDFMGSRYDFTTRLLFAVDVSGSMSDEDLALGFSVVNRFFKYGIRSIDVIQFDTEVKGEPLSLKRARHVIEVTGRGGTSFEPVIEFINQRSCYDGAIIFTDGVAPVPPRPTNRRTRILWLFDHEGNYDRQHGLAAIGRMAYLKEAPVQK